MQVNGREQLTLNVLQSVVLDNEDVGLVVLDESKTVIIWNDWMTQHSKLNSNQVLGKKIIQLFPKFRHSRLDYACSEAISCGVSSFISNTFNDYLIPLYNSHDKDDEINQLIKIKSLRMPDDSHCCLIQVADVGHLQNRNNRVSEQAERTIRLVDDIKYEKNRMMAILEGAGDSIITFDYKGIVESANKATEAIFGYTCDEIQGRHIKTIIPELNDSRYADFSSTLKNLGIAHKDAHGIRGYITGVSKNKEMKLLDFVANEMEGDFSSRYVAMIRDVTGDYEAKNKTQQRSKIEKFSTQGINDAMITTDVNGKIEYCNSYTQSILRKSTEDLYGKLLSQAFTFIDGDTKKEIVNIVDSVVASNAVIHSAKNSLLRLDDNNDIPITYTASPVSNKNNEVSGCLLVFRDSTDVSTSEERLSWHMIHDELTQLPNRRYFEEKLASKVEEAKRLDVSHGLLYLDLDQFKVVNDICGHQAGDELLRRVSNLFNTQLRSDDIVARIGGDEFGVLLNDCPLQGMRRVAKHLCEILQNYSFSWDSKLFKISVSVGAVNITRETESPAAALVAADSSCYAAKEAGRNRVHIYHDDVSVQLRHSEMHWVSEINEAFHDDRFCLYTQLIKAIDKDCGDKDHYEVLVRIVDKDGKVISPIQFIPPAERFGLMNEIDRWVVKATLSYIADQKNINIETVYSINLSGVSIGDSSFMQFLIAEFKSIGVDFQQVCFEVTETAAIGDLQNAKEFINYFHAKGCLFALDDFGTGLSSFAYLKELPVDYLKIDGSFVKNMLNDHVDYAMVSMISHLGNVMKIKTIAEFVENEEIMEALSKIGVNYAQGYGIQKPFPLNLPIPNGYTGKMMH